MNHLKLHMRLMHLALGLGTALSASSAIAANYQIEWLQMTPTPLGSTLPPGGGTFSAGVAGIGPVSVMYTQGSGLSTVRLAHPLLQNGSLLAPNQDSYSWGAQELLARTYHTQAPPFVAGTGQNQNWGVSYAFNQPLVAGTQLVVGVMGLGRRLPNDASETVFETTTTATIMGILGPYQNLGDFGSSNNWGQTVVTPGPNSLTLVNSQVGHGGIDPWWNTGLNLTVISPTQPMHALSVMFDQTLGDGVGVNIGFINAVPEPGQWALMVTGLAALGWLGLRRAQG